MTEDEYDNSYTSTNVLKREKCELNIFREVVQPNIISATAYKQLLDEMKKLNKQLSKNEITTEEYNADTELLAMVYVEKLQNVTLAAHNQEVGEWDNIGSSFSNSYNKARTYRPTQTTCYNTGNITQCNSY